MSEMKLPLKVKIAPGDVLAYIVDATGRIVEDSIEPETADLFVTAVNSHSRLVEALEAARKRLAEIPGEGRLIVQINEALADVKEEKR